MLVPYPPDLLRDPTGFGDQVRTSIHKSIKFIAHWKSDAFECSLKAIFKVDNYQAFASAASNSGKACAWFAFGSIKLWSMHGFLSLKAAAC